MLPIIQIHAKLFVAQSGVDRKRSQKSMLWFLEALCQHNSLWLDLYDTPLLYDTDIRYLAEPPNREHWQDIPTCIERKTGDCEDLSCYRVGELRHAGIMAHPYIKWRLVNGSHRYHCLVQWPDGRIEDPSIALGMAGPMYRKPIFLNEV